MSETGKLLSEINCKIVTAISANIARKNLSANIVSKLVASQNLVAEVSSAWTKW